MQAVASALASSFSIDDPAKPTPTDSAVARQHERLPHGLLPQRVRLSVDGCVKLASAPVVSADARQSTRAGLDADFANSSLLCREQEQL